MNILYEDGERKIGTLALDAMQFALDVLTKANWKLLEIARNQIK